MLFIVILVVTAIQFRDRPAIHLLPVMTAVVPEARQSGTVLPRLAPKRRRWPFSPWHLVLIPATIILLFPFVWLVVTSLETSSEALRFRRT